MAAVSEPSSSNRFFCHQCNVEIPRVLPDFKCPTCNTGFIEEMEAQPRYPMSDESSDEGEADIVSPFIGGLLTQSILNSIVGNNVSAATDEASGIDASSTRPGSSSGAGTRRRRPEGSLHSPVRAIRRRTSSADNRQHPLENLIQEIFIDFPAFGLDQAMLQAQGSPMFLYGNPGDYAFGRAGLDAIITQILNQMDGTGPPPMARDKIAEIPTVRIQQAEVDKNMQCSVCWDDFKLDEPVRKLVCEHLYHEQCIIPWLQLHGTCPICRKSLNDDSESENSTSNSPGPSSFSANATDGPANGAGTSASNGATSLFPSPNLPGFFSSVIGTLSNAFNSVSSPLRSQQSSSASASSSQQSESGTVSSQPSTSVRHPYHLRRRERPSEQDATGSNGSSRTASESNQRSHTQDHSRYNFEDEYD